MISKKLRDSILQRDNHRCQMCFKTFKKLIIHHIIPRRLMGTDNTSNLTTLCTKCHGLVELKVKFCNFIAPKPSKRLIFTPCCNYQQATSKSKHQMIACTNCKTKFVGV